MRLDEELEALRGQVAALEAEKSEMEQNAADLKKEHVENSVKSFGEKLGNKEEWKDTATNFAERLTKAGTQLSKFLVDTVQTVAENVDWKDTDFNIKIPGLITSKFQHEFIFDQNTATILDFQLANGNVTLQSWDNETISVAADVKIYGKTEEATAKEAFDARSTIVMDEDKLTFRVPNKRVKCDIVVSLPKREYDYVAIKMLNGNATLKNIEGKRFLHQIHERQYGYFRSQGHHAGDGWSQRESGRFGKSTIVDVLAKTINGSLTIKSDVVSATVSVVNGDVKLSYPGTNAKQIQASSVNGSVKLSLPAAKSAEVKASSSLGKIMNRMENIEILRQKNEHTNKYLEFRRMDEESPVMVELKTTKETYF